MSLTLTASTSTTTTPFGDEVFQRDTNTKRRPPSAKARMIAAATGATMTGLTMTPFDVIKTRMQTAPPRSLRPSIPFPPPRCPSCLPQPPATCALSPLTARNLSSLVLASTGTGGRHTTLCAWDVGWVNERRGIKMGGFWDGLGKVWRTEGFPGLWKGVGTTLVMSVPSQTLYMLTYSHLLYTLPASPTTPLLSGILSRTLITTLVSPLELLRTRLQATPHPSGPPITLRATLSTLSHMVRDAGPTTLWRGLGPSLWRDVPFSGVYWLLQHNITLALSPSLPPHLLGAPLAFASGFSAGSVASLLTNPFDVLKTRRQTASLPQEVGTVRALMDVWREEGWRALWVGVGPRTAKIAPACGIMIACYEGVARIME